MFKKKSKPAPEKSGYPTGPEYPAQGATAYPAQGATASAQPPPYSYSEGTPSYAAPPPYGQYGAGPYGEAPYGQQPYGQPQPYGQQPHVPGPGVGAPQQPTTYVIQGGFDAGARFDGVSKPGIPPPPPGCAPNMAQLAAFQGQNVVVTQRKGNFWEGGSSGGYTMF